MSFATMLVRWLAGRLSGAAGMPGRPLAPAAHAALIPPLRWRAPWLAWQLLSWSVLTLLAPPVWMIGMLLLINPASDQPLFWGSRWRSYPSQTGSRSSRRTSGITACRSRGVRWSRRTCSASRWPSVVRCSCCCCGVRTRSPARSARWQTTACVRDARVLGRRPAALFGVTSSAHASIAHAWLAFEV